MAPRVKVAPRCDDTALCSKWRPAFLSWNSRPERVPAAGALLRSPPDGRLCVLLEIDPLAQFLACLEMGHVLLRHLHLLAGLGIAPRPRRAVVQAEAAEAA